MATLSYPITYGDWSGTINLNYTAEYDRENNRTKITFGQCSAVYSSRADYQPAPGREALFGWLWLRGRTDRLTELFTQMMEEA